MVKFWTLMKKAFHEGMLEAAKNMLLENFSVETIYRVTELPISEITNLKMSLNREIYSLYLQTFSILFLNFSTELPKTSAVNMAPPAPAPSFTKPVR